MGTHIKIIGLLIVALFGSACKSNKDASSKTAAKENAVVSEKVTAAVGLNLGNRAPEIELKNPDGKVIKLSTLRGKVVLIDFWASWCGPCRAENPTVVMTHSKYKDQKFKEGNGFEIYSVSLDKDAGTWKKAIEKDGLIWPYHVSDLLGWSSSAALTYAVYAIPTNYLINGDGIIVAKGLRGEDLHKTLENLTVK